MGFSEGKQGIQDAAAQLSQTPEIYTNHEKKSIIRAIVMVNIQKYTLNIGMKQANLFNSCYAHTQIKHKLIFCYQQYILCFHTVYISKF